MLGAGGALVSSGSAAPRAGVANVPDLTGSWTNKDGSPGPAWQFTAGNELHTLDATWSGGPGHSQLRGEFHGDRFGGTEYKGPFHITEEKVKVDGTMRIVVRSSAEVEIYLTPESEGSPSGTPSSYIFERVGAPPTPSSPTQLIAAPSAFGQTVETAAPPPGGAAVQTSPEIGNASAVEAKVEGLSTEDAVLAVAARRAVKQVIEQHCFYVATRNVITRIKLSKHATHKFTPESELDTVAQGLRTVLVREAAACIVSLESDLGLSGSSAARSDDSAATPCASVPLTFVSRHKHGKSRLVGIHVGGAGGVTVKCQFTDGTMKLRVASKSHKPLRRSIGSRLVLAVGRGGRDAAGGTLRLSYRKG
ncbi:MAG TPA: hypothetical protein VMI13_13310 [Solirubrobacteraceae bacterium]|nr:hypothetical protein [Solirubrobacteraceae bacterium]